MFKIYGEMLMLGFNCMDLLSLVAYVLIIFSWVGYMNSGSYCVTILD